MAIEALDLLRDDTKRNTYAKNGLQNAKYFDWNTTACEISVVLRETLTKQGKSTGEQYVS
jgi:hypothetical protein